jgi:hypothetical protein
MVAESCLEPLQDLVREYGGTICYQKNAQAASKGAALLNLLGIIQLCTLAALTRL